MKISGINSRGLEKRGSDNYLFTKRKFCFISKEKGERGFIMLLIGPLKASRRLKH